MSKRRKDDDGNDGAPREELKIRTAPVDDDGRFGRLALIFCDGKRYSLERATVIGSEPGVDIRLDDPCV